MISGIFNNGEFVFHDKSDKIIDKFLVTDVGRIYYSPEMTNNVQVIIDKIKNALPRDKFPDIYISKDRISIFYEDIDSEIIFKNIISFGKWREFIRNLPPFTVLLDNYWLRKYVFYNGVLFVKWGKINREVLRKIAELIDKFESVETIKISVDDLGPYRVVITTGTGKTMEIVDGYTDDIGNFDEIRYYEFFSKNRTEELQFMWCVINK